MVVVLEMCLYRLKVTEDYDYATPFLLTLISTASAIHTNMHSLVYITFQDHIMIFDDNHTDDDSNFMINKAVCCYHHHHHSSYLFCDVMYVGKGAVVKTSTRQTVFLPIPGLVRASELTPGELVGTNKDSYIILGELVSVNGWDVIGVCD